MCSIDKIARPVQRNQQALLIKRLSSRGEDLFFIEGVEWIYGGHYIYDESSTKLLRGTQLEYDRGLLLDR